VVKHEKIGNEKAKQMSSEQVNKQTRKKALKNDHKPESDKQMSKGENDEKG